MTLEADGLLAGPRGRRLCLELALTARPAEDEAMAQLRTAAFYAAYDLDPGRGSSTVLFGPGVDERSGPPPAPSPREVARLLDAVPLPDLDEGALVLALAASVDSARYWQEPDGEDVLAAAPEVRAALARVASAVASAISSAPWAARWSDPVDSRDQWHVTFGDVTDAGPQPTLTAREVLDRWQPLELEEEAVARRDRPVDPAAMISGTWWSRPPGLTNTTRALPGRGPLGLWFVEDGFGWKAAAVERVRVPEAARVFEIDSPEAWAELVRRYPLEVTASRRHDWYRVTGRNGVWVIPDWSRVRDDFDAVHLSIAGYLATAGRAIRVDAERATVLAGWDPDSTYWLVDVAREASTRAAWHLDDASRVWTPSPEVDRPRTTP